MFKTFGDTSSSHTRTLQHTKYIYINSTNRNTGTNSEPVVYIPPNLLMSHNSKGVFKISLYSLTINREWYNIINGVNNVLEYYNGVITQSIVLQEGSYSVYAFRDYLNTVLVGMTLTYSITTNTFTFTPVNPSSTIKPINCGTFLGLINNKIYTGTFNSENPINMLYEADLYINSDIAQSSYNLDNVNNTEVQSSTIIEKVPVNVPPFGNIIFNANELHSSLEIPLLTQITNIKFWITTNRLRKLTNLQQPWTMTLRIDVYED